jgi:CDP-diglyceride synthetase
MKLILKIFLSILISIVLFLVPILYVYDEVKYNSKEFYISLGKLSLYVLCILYIILYLYIISKLFGNDIAEFVIKVVFGIVSGILILGVLISAIYYFVNNTDSFIFLIIVNYLLPLLIFLVISGVIIAITLFKNKIKSEWWKK